MRASVGLVRGSSFLSSFFAYFFSNGKSMKKERKTILSGLVGTTTTDKKKYCWCRYAKTPTMAKIPLLRGGRRPGCMDLWGQQPRTNHQ